MHLLLKSATVITITTLFELLPFVITDLSQFYTETEELGQKISCDMGFLASILRCGRLKWDLTLAGLASLVEDIQSLDLYFWNP